MTVVWAIKWGMPVFEAVAQFARALEWKNSAKTGQNRTKQEKTGRSSTLGYAAMLNFEFDSGIGDKVGHASFRDRSAICTRLRMEKQWENRTKQVKTGKNSTSGYVAKLNFELDRGILAIKSDMPILWS